jgi:ribosomal protein S18 acetylase RimI-like enzyme
LTGARDASETVRLSAIDRERFGVVTARSPLVTAAALPDVLAYCQEHGVEMLVARCDAADLSAAHAVEGCGGRLMDALVYFQRDLVRYPIPGEPPLVSVRVAGAGDAEAVCRVAAEGFRGYGGHYHADRRLDRAACDETYADWARRSCLHAEVAEAVLVAEVEGRVAGFLTLRSNGPDEAEIVLNAVLPAFQRGGIYRCLVVEAMRWSRQRGAARLVISTQLTNVPVQKAWVRLGFEPSRAYYTFHVWFERPAAGGGVAGTGSTGGDPRVDTPSQPR